MSRTRRLTALAALAAAAPLAAAAAPAVASPGQTTGGSGPCLLGSGIVPVNGTYHLVFGDGIIEATAPAVAGIHDVTPACFDDPALIVIDRGAGFVTGGGWILAPVPGPDTPPGGGDGGPGGPPPDPVLGRANFGFVSQYHDGVVAPVGATEFQFQAGGINFHTNAHDWLVIPGDGTAVFGGEGLVNHVGGHPFRVTVTDGGGRAGDTFRITIWKRAADGGGVLYDSTVRPLRGGQITLHKEPGPKR